MTAAIDTNILIDILFPGAVHQQASLARLAEHGRRGGLIISEVVFAELAGYFGDEDGLMDFLSQTGVALEPSGPPALLTAGKAWLEYTRRRRAELVCPECGQRQRIQCANCGRAFRPRQHVVADLMIGAHALHHADGLLTRDRGFYAAYFPDLVLL